MTKTPRKCALCDVLLRAGNDSKEHIIPKAIGGRRTVQGFLCRACNTMTGEEWDDILARQLNPLSNLLNIKRERGRPPTLVVDTIGGQQLRHRSDGHMTTHRYRVSERRHADKTSIHLTAPSMSELKRHLRGLIRTYPQLEGVNLLEMATRRAEYVADPMVIDLNFGGLQAGRSVVKSCVALAHVDGVRLSDLEQAREYLGGRDAPCFGYYNETDVVLNRPPRTFFHCVHVRGDERRGTLLGYVELFGCQRMVVLLSDSYAGGSFSQCYAVDPVAGRTIDLVVDLPDFSAEEIQAIYDDKKVDFEKTRIALGYLIEWYIEKSNKRARSMAIREAVTYALTNCGAELGKAITEEQCERLVTLLVEHLTPFLLHQRGRPSNRGVDPIRVESREGA